jgi:hypothetical protein
LGVYELTEIWVLGSRSDGASEVVSWEIPFPDLLKSDVLIINLETLRKALIENLALKNALFDKVRRDVFDILMAAGKQVIVVLPTVLSDLSWLPIYPDCDPITPTETVGKVGDQALNKYLELVQTTDYYFRSVKFAFVSDKKPSSSGRLAQEFYSTELLHSCDILNVSKQLVGGAFKMVIERKLTYLGSLVSSEEFASNSMLFLPPPTEISVEKGIDVLIGLVASEKKQLCL